MYNENDLKTEYFECECRDMSHTIRFWYDSKEIEIYTEVFLNPDRPWWKRIWAAMKYIFGVTTQSHFDMFLLKTKDVERVMKMCQEFEIAKLEVDRKKQP